MSQRKFTWRTVPEAALVVLLLLLFRLMGLRVASCVGGTVARCLGPRLKVHTIARENMQRAFPHWPEEKIVQTLDAMWDNLGRTVAELPHLARLHGAMFRQHVQVSGFEHVEAARQQGAIIFLGGHLGNWELGPRTTAELGAPMAAIYRPANNALVNAMIQHCRRGSHAGMFPKGKAAAKEMVRVLKAGGVAGMLVDQKMNDGIPVEFFSRPAMTAPAIAELALKYHAAIIPARVVRVRGVQFESRFETPLDVAGKSIPQIMREVNQVLERWITETPEQWFWVHKRWPRG